MDSHIQMPRFLLKRFCNKSEKLYYYDVNKRVFGNNGRPKSLNTSPDYYSKSIEDRLNVDIEGPFSKFLIQLEKIDFDNPSFQVDSKQELSVKRFLYALLVRNPKMLQYIAENSVYYQFLSPQSQHDFAVDLGMHYAVKDRLFDSFFFTFAVNKTNESFILPTCGIYGVESTDKPHAIFLPVSPKIAIVVLDNRCRQNLTNNGIIPLLLLDSEAQVNEMNLCAFQTQCSYETGFIVSPDKAPLEMCVQRAKKNNTDFYIKER